MVAMVFSAKLVMFCLYSNYLYLNYISILELSLYSNYLSCGLNLADNLIGNGQCCCGRRTGRIKNMDLTPALFKVEVIQNLAIRLQRHRPYSGGRDLQMLRADPRDQSPQLSHKCLPRK